MFENIVYSIMEFKLGASFYISIICYQIGLYYIFIIFQGKEAEAANVYDDVFKGQAAWRKLSAVQNGRVVVLPKNLFHFKPNAKWDEAYRYIYEIFE